MCSIETEFIVESIKMYMKDNHFIKSLQKGLNKDEIASNIHHHLDDCIINGECCNVGNGKVTSC